MDGQRVNIPVPADAKRDGGAMNMRADGIARLTYF